MPKTEAQKARHRAHYLANRDAYLARSQKQRDDGKTAAWKRDNRDQLNEYARNYRIERLDKLKRGKSCAWCGEDFPDCLDFHHIDPSAKLHNVGQLVVYAPQEVLDAEVAKCIVLCANCHRKYHALEREGVTF